MGPMTGRGSGGCSNGEQAMMGNRVRGFGHGAGRREHAWGRGRGHCFGSGRGRMFGAPQPDDVTVDQELASLKNQAAFMEEQMSSTRRRIEELEMGENKEDT